MRASFLLPALLLPLAAQPALPPAAAVKVDYEKHIKPLMAEKCHSCHGERAQQAGLRLDKRQNAMRGGDYGPVIIAGDSAASKLIKRVVNGDGGMLMPPTGALSPDEIALLRAWIDQGVDFRIEVKDEAPPKPVDPKLATLIAAVRASDIPAIEKNLALVNAADPEGSTPLHHAAAFATPATVKRLLAAGANANVKNRYGATPLHRAIGDEAKVRLLLDAGADKNARLNDGRSVLYQVASINNANPILRLLLDKGADPNVALANGQTPLMAAANHGNVEAMRLLLAAKANPNARTGAGATALLSAAASRNPRAVEILLAAGADPNAATKKNETALAAAATAGDLESLQNLLAKGAKVNVADDRGYTPLLLAAASESRNAAAVKLLLDHGADRNARADGESFQQLAAKRGATEVARLAGVGEKELAAIAAPGPRGARRPAPVSVSQALKLLETQSHNFIRIGGCNSCHAQDLPSAAAGFARSRGITAPREVAQLPVSMTANNPERILDLVSPAVPSIGWEMFDRAQNSLPPDSYTDSAVQYIKLMQHGAGNWSAPEGRRPPMNTGDFQATALSIFTLKAYTPASGKADSAARIARAAAWLTAARPESTQDRAFHLLGLAWAGASPKVIEDAARGLAALQRPDGGFGQHPTMPSDAYATGQALFALHTAGKMAVTAPGYKKGADFLLDSQAPDGSWLVRTRAIWLQPYFESGFPYAHDQWISAAGTAWASMALSLTVEPVKLSRR